MRRQTMEILAFVLILAVSGVAASAPKGPQATGTVKEIDTQGMTLTIQTHAGAQTFKLDSSEVILVKGTGKRLRMGDLKTGERVRVRYTKSGGQMQASRIEVLPEQHASDHAPRPTKPTNQ
ncbi:MAG TPA: DUF5666 domain-containing protein [Candidatus Polarisedimenticolia bacterium]|nr:DUF5666 domain-containing protein [Candidatus Polarisedimenticolia bacterium]